MYASKKEKLKSLKKQQHLLIGPPVQALQTLTNEKAANNFTYLSANHHTGSKSAIKKISLEV
jgi:hypothetical protein